MSEIKEQVSKSQEEEKMNKQAEIEKEVEG